MNRFFSAISLIALLSLSPQMANAQEAGEYTMSANEITKVQTFLIEWGYSHAKTREEAFFLPNGKIGPRTQRAITDLQKDKNWPETGYLTEKQFEIVTETPLPSDRTWGALSIAADGSYGTASDYSSGIGAYIAAQEECRSKTTDPCDRALASYRTPKSNDKFIVALWCENSDGSRGYGTTAATTPKLAIERIYSLLFEDDWKKSECTTKVVLNVKEGEVFE